MDLPPLSREELVTLVGDLSVTVFRLQKLVRHLQAEGAALQAERDRLSGAAFAPGASHE